jgi:hypothetical protein
MYVQRALKAAEEDKAQNSVSACFPECVRLLFGKCVLLGQVGTQRKVFKI